MSQDFEIVDIAELSDDELDAVLGGNGTLEPLRNCI